MNNFLRSDLIEIAKKTEPLHENFRKANIIILGAHGFIGNWLCQSLMHLNQNLDLKIEITGIIRNSGGLESRPSHFYQEKTFQSWINSIDNKEVTHVFHCATNSRGLNENGKKSVDEIIELTNLAISKVSKNSVPKFIHLSSGAVYGDLARTRNIIRTNSPIGSNENLDLYGKLKIIIENLVGEATAKGKILGGNPRLFSFYGPGLGLDEKFAISSFVKAAHTGKLIEITGNPATERTYMYPTDLIARILKCAEVPSVETIHIGGAKVFSMHEIAEAVARTWNVALKLPTGIIPEPNFYNPEVQESETCVELDEGLLRWKYWLEKN